MMCLLYLWSGLGSSLGEEDLVEDLPCRGVGEDVASEVLDAGAVGDGNTSQEDELRCGIP